ncbi:MAG: hypothetical protein AAF824_02180, partial [Bacteroidota bacterium]
MPTLQELKDTWFIDQNTVFEVPDFENVDPENEGTVDPDQLPNLISTTFANLGMNFRYPGAPLANHTDGN